MLNRLCAFTGEELIQNMVIEPELAKAYGLDNWKCNLSGTAGIRDAVNTIDFHDPKAPLNYIKVLVYAEARARALEKQYADIIAKGGRINIAVSGEVRYHTPEALKIQCAVFAAHGFIVHTTVDFEPSTVWAGSFGAFYNEYQGSDVDTSSHSPSNKIGIKPAGPDGGQLLADDANLVMAEAVEIQKEALITGIMIRMAGLDAKNIIADFDISKPYAEYMKSILGQAGYSALAQNQDLGVPLICVGGSAGYTQPKVLHELGLPKLIDFRYNEKDPEFHNFGGKVGPDPSKAAYYEDPRITDIASEKGFVALTDPDNDRYGRAEKIPANMVEAAKKVGIETFEKNGEFFAVYNPNQIATQQAIFRLEQMSANGELKKNKSYAIITTFPSCYLVEEIVTKLRAKTGADIKVIRVPVGFKYVNQAQATLKNQNYFDQLDGTRVNFDNTDIEMITAFEESGGTIHGAKLVSLNGNNTALCLPEKDAMQPLMIDAYMLAVLRPQYGEGAITQNYIDLINRYNPRLIIYRRKDITLYNERLMGAEREAAKKEGTKKKDRIIDFFQSLPELFAKEGSAAVLAKIKTQAANLELPEIAKAFNINSGDDKGTYIFFTDGTWFAVRPSGTDAVLRYYGEEMNVEMIIKRLNSFADIDPVTVVEGSTAENKVNDKESKGNA